VRILLTAGLVERDTLLRRIATLPMDALERERRAQWVKLTAPS
jgi:hypothetical protein